MERTKQVLAEWEMKLACPVCNKLPEHPHLLHCTHSFCKSCIIELDRCPKCDLRVTPKDIVPNLMLGKLLNFMRASSAFANRNHPSTSEEKDAKFSSKPINESSNKNIVPKETISTIKTPDSIKNQNRRKHSSNITKSNGSNKDLNLKTSIIDETSKLEPKTPVRKKRQGKGPKKDSEEETDGKIQKNSAKPFTLYSAKKSQCLNKINTNGETRLQIACRQGKLSLVQQLLDEGAEPNVKDYANWTPLCDAVNHGHLEVVQALLRAGACANTPAQSNTTALVEAVVRRDMQMVRLLTRHGADPHQRTALNNTAFSLADDELKAIMLEANGVPIQPHVRVPLAPKTVLIGELPQEDVDKVMELCKRFNLTLTTVFSPDVTHVVVAGGVSAAGGREALLGLAAGCCVVSSAWAAASLRAAAPLAPDGHEPTGTPDYLDTCAFTRSRVNREKLLPRLFDGAHVSLHHRQRWPARAHAEAEVLVRAAGAAFQPREMDAERVPPNERTVMFHAPCGSALATVSHLVLYRDSEREPELKYNMPHIKSLPLSWFTECVQNFEIRFDPNKYFNSGPQSID